MNRKIVICALSCTFSYLCATETQAEIQTKPSSGQKIAVHIRPYNVTWKNDFSHILGKVYDFIKSNKGLSARLLATTTLAPEALWKVAHHNSLPEFYQLFDRTNPEGQVKDLAIRLTYEGKKAIDPGLTFVQRCPQKNITLSYCLNLPEADQKKACKLFPFLAKAQKLFSSTQDFVDAYKDKKNCTKIIVSDRGWKEKRPEAVKAAKDAGCHVIHVDVQDKKAADQALDSIQKAIAQ